MFIHRARRALTPQSATPVLFIIIVIVIVEKKITLSVIFFSTVTVIGMHCNALYHGKVKVGKVRGIVIINK